MALTVVLLALAALAAFAQGAEEEKGSWSVAGWARANSGWDFEGEALIPQAPDADATGAETTVTYTKGVWKVAGTANVTSANFGATYSASGNITATYASGDWTVYGKLAQGFNFDAQGEWLDTDPTTDSDGDGKLGNDKDRIVNTASLGRTLQFSAENWKQDANVWGFKGIVQLNVLDGETLPAFRHVTLSDDNKAALFINFWDKKILLETGYGDYTGTVWTSPGPYEVQYESADDEDPALRVQFKVVPGLNFGFAYLPAIGHTGVNAGFADSTPDNSGYPVITGFGTWKPGDAIRATTFGAKYASGPLTVATGLNLKKDAEKVYGGFAYKLLDDTITLSLDGDGQNLGVFGDAGIFNLGERIKYASGPLEAQLTFKENNLAHNSAGGVAAKDLQLVVSPYVQYDIIEKVARAKLAFDLTKGLGDANKDDTEWKLTALFGWSLNESPAVDPDSIGRGFVIGYQYGVKDVGGTETTTNKLYFGFKATF
jgi:hypothetical protein